MGNFLQGIFSKRINNIARNLAQNMAKNKIYESIYGKGLVYTQYDQNNKTYVNKGYNSNSDVYAVVSQKATEVTRIPYYIKSVKDLQSKERYSQFMHMCKGIISPDTLLKKVKYSTKAFEEKEYNMPLDKPNAYQTWREFFALYETFMDLTGNFYIYLKSPIDGMNAGTPTEMHILPSHLTQIVLKENVNFLSDESPVDYYIFTDGNSNIRFSQTDVIHIKLPNPNFDLNGSHLYGHSPLRAALTNIQSSNSATRLNARTLANGGSFGFISTKEPMTHEQGDSLKERLIEMDNSQERMSNIGGSAKEVVFTRISLTTDELKPFEYLEYDQKAICNVLHWDDKLLNSDDGAKYDNYKAAIRRGITSGISPNLRLLEESFNRDILPRFKSYKGTVLLFDESELPEMQQDMESLTKNLTIWLKDGAINRDEYRCAINYTETGNSYMQTHTVDRNIISLEDALTLPEDITFNTEDEPKQL